MTGTDERSTRPQVVFGRRYRTGPALAPKLRGGLAAKNAQEMIGVQVSGVPLEGLQVVGLGARELARLVQGDALTEQG